MQRIGWIGLAVTVSCCGCSTRYKESVRAFNESTAGLGPHAEVILSKSAALDERTRGTLYSEMDRLSASAMPNVATRLVIAQRGLDSYGSGLNRVAAELEVTRSALKVVTQYAAALDGLANGNSAPQIRASTEALTTALSGLDAQLTGKLGLSQPVPNSSFTRGELLGGAIRLIGERIAERKRANYTGMIAQAFDAPLREIGRQLESQTQIAERFVKDQYSTQYDQEFRAPVVKCFDALSAAKQKNDAAELLRVQAEISTLEERAKARLAERDALLTEIRSFRAEFARVVARHAGILQSVNEKDFVSAITAYTAESAGICREKQSGCQLPVVGCR